MIQQAQKAEPTPAKVARQSTSSDNYERISKLYEQLISLLQAGRIEPAVALFVPEDQARMRALFTKEAKTLPGFVASLGKPILPQSLGHVFTLEI